MTAVCLHSGKITWTVYLHVWKIWQKAVFSYNCSYILKKFQLVFFTFLKNVSCLFTFWSQCKLDMGAILKMWIFLFTVMWLYLNGSWIGSKLRLEKLSLTKGKTKEYSKSQIWLPTMWYQYWYLRLFWRWGH